MMKPKMADSATTPTLTTYFGPKMPINTGVMQGSKKAQARTTGNQTKMTKPPDTTTLRHKSPITERNPTMTNTMIQTSNLTPQVTKQTEGSPTTVAMKNPAKPDTKGKKPGNSRKNKN